MANIKYAFLITDGTELLMRPAWGVTREEARRYLSLNKAWSVVEDPEVINTFIAEKKREEMPENLHKSLAEQWLEYDRNLDKLLA